MKRYILLRIVLCMVMLLTGTFIQIKAQSNEKFEGEITFETYENYSDYILRMGNSIYFNGVHKMRLILKGDKMHLIDETTKCHVVVDNSVPSYVHFCDLTKTGMDFEKNIGAMQLLSKGSIEVSGQAAPITSYTFAATDTKRNVMDRECTLDQGDINRNMGGMEQKYSVKAYISDIIAPEGYKWHLFCLDTPGIALKYSYKYDGGHISIANVGELSIYYEADVTNITRRNVADEEFNIPNDYKISKGAKNAFALMKYYKGIKKQLEKLGIKGESNDKKTTGVHYKTDDEWNF